MRPYRHLVGVIRFLCTAGHLQSNQSLNRGPISSLCLSQYLSTEPADSKGRSSQAPRVKIASVPGPDPPGRRPLLLRTLAFSLLLCYPSLAAPISQSYLCVQGHEQEATTKLQTFVKQAVINFFKDRKIAIDSSSLQVNLSSGTRSGYDAPSSVSFTGGATSASPLAASSVAATVAAQDGTKFNVLISSGSDSQDAAEYRVVSTQQGFDREGNAIHQHCALRLFNSGDGEATENLLVINATSGHALWINTFTLHDFTILEAHGYEFTAVQSQKRSGGP
jgi:hypothetical protein